MHFQNIVLKIGTNVITTDDGLLDLEVMQQLVAQVAFLHSKKINVVMVSSGAMGAGRSLVQIPPTSNKIAKRQVLAAVGQPQLLNAYMRLFATHSIACAQVLATKSDFKDRRHYLNMQTCFKNLVKNQIVPVVNENDVVSVDELMFTDNDELAGMVASMLNAEALLIATSVDGVYDRSPSDPQAQLIETINTQTKLEEYVTTETSDFGRGGMLTKCHVAQKLAKLGVATYMFDGRKPDSIQKIALKQPVTCTTFVPDKNTSQVKKWVANNEGLEKGRVYINKCAAEVLTSTEKVASLLPVGVVRVEGEFQKGDIVRIMHENGRNLGLGMAQYDDQKARKNLGKSQQKPLVHYDYLYLE